MKFLNKFLNIFADQAQDSEIAQKTYLKGIALLEIKEYKRASKYFEEAIRSDKTHTGSWYNLGVFHQTNNNNEEAILCFRSCLKHNPENDNAWINLGLSLGKLNRHKEELDSYNQAVSLLERENYEEKYADYQDFLEARFLAWKGKGISEKHQFLHEDAKNSFEKALTIRPNDSQLLFNYGIVLGILGKKKEAIETFKKINNEQTRIEFNDYGGVFAFAQNRLRIKYLSKEASEKKEQLLQDVKNLQNRNLYQNALNVCLEALEYDHCDYDVLINLAICFFYTKKYEDSIKYIDRIIEVIPEFFVPKSLILELKADCFHQLNRHDEAKECLYLAKQYED